MLPFDGLQLYLIDATIDEHGVFFRDWGLVYTLFIFWCVACKQRPRLFQNARVTLTSTGTAIEKSQRLECESEPPRGSKKSRSTRGVREKVAEQRPAVGTESPDLGVAIGIEKPI
jgi:hypothetical protein